MIIFGWIVFAIVAGFVGSGRKIGFGWAFFWSLLLSPLVGLIIAFASDKKSDIEARNIQQAQARYMTKVQQDQAQRISEKPIYEQIKDAKSLWDSGAITEEEFEAIKKKIINKQ